jgi:hypothetical protein
MLQFATRGWSDAIDLDILADKLPSASRMRVLAAPHAALHVLIATGVGGVLPLEGRPVSGAQGAIFLEPVHGDQA